MADGRPLDKGETEAALAAVAAWRSAPDGAVACPRCGAVGLAVSDHSARPHTEWYRILCAACGMDQMITTPLGASVPGQGD